MAPALPFPLLRLGHHHHLFFVRRAAAAASIVPNFATSVSVPVPVIARTTTAAKRTMASSAPAPRKYEWLVVVPDFPGVLEKRLQVRPDHFAGIQKFTESGVFKMGGAILDEVPPDDEPSSLKFCGSSLVVIAESREEILGYLSQDTYTKSGVWDLSKVQMWPLKSAFRNP